MALSKILLVSDDVETAYIWIYTLTQQRIETTLLAPSEKADTEARYDAAYDLILIDLSSTPASAVKLIRHLREDSTLPILVLSAEPEALMLEFYQAGADEVIPKPISFKLFLAKISAWLRRSHTVPTALLDSLQVGDLRLDTAQRQLLLPSGSVVRLSGLEFRLLHLMMSHPGQILESNTIINRIWGAGDGDAALLKNLVYRVRRKVELDPSRPRYIQSIVGEGYTFSPSSPE